MTFERDWEEVISDVSRAFEYPVSLLLLADPASSDERHQALLAAARARFAELDAATDDNVLLFLPVAPPPGWVEGVYTRYRSLSPGAANALFRDRHRLQHALGRERASALVLELAATIVIHSDSKPPSLPALVLLDDNESADGTLFDLSHMDAHIIPRLFDGVVRAAGTTRPPSAASFRRALESYVATDSIPLMSVRTGFRQLKDLLSWLLQRLLK
jgi:hypothetical protein